jgi:hypothetical protein
MTDEKERVDWSALMDAHGIEPDANTASPAVEPSRRVEADEGEQNEAGTAEQREAGRRRLVHVIVAVCALFSIAASAAVLIAILRGGGDRDERAERESADDRPLAPVGPRPAAFEQTSDGVTVVPPASGSPQPGAETPRPAAETSPRIAETSPPAAETPPPAAEAPPAGAKKPPPAAEAPPTGAKKPQPAGEAPPHGAKKPPPGAKKPPPGAETPPAAAKGPPGGEAEPEPAGAAQPADPNLPEQPDMEGVAAAMAKLESDINACAAPAKVSGEVGIKMRIEPDGSVPWASAKVQNSQFQACLDRLFKKARMPRSQKGATVRQTLDLP